MDSPNSELSFFARLGLAFGCFFRIVGNGAFAGRVAALDRPAPAPVPLPKVAAAPAPTPKPAAPKPVELPPERAHASGLLVLGMLQREGRLIDFLREDMAAFGDADIGAAARVVHAGCRKVLDQYLTLEPIRPEAEGDAVAVPAGFDAQRIRLTGNIAGQPPYRGTLKHHGWAASAVRLPAVSEAVDPRVLAPAEVEL